MNGLHHMSLPMPPISNKTAETTAGRAGVMPQPVSSGLSRYMVAPEYGMSKNVDVTSKAPIESRAAAQAECTGGRLTSEGYLSNHHQRIDTVAAGISGLTTYRQVLLLRQQRRRY